MDRYLVRYRRVNVLTVGGEMWVFKSAKNEDAIGPENAERLKKQGRKYFTSKEA